MENEILSLSELAERMCVSKRRVQQFAQDGLVRRVAHGLYTIPKFYVNESRDEGLDLAGLEAAIQRDLKKTETGKKDRQGVGRSYCNRNNGLASNARTGAGKIGIAPPSPIKSKGYAYQ